MLATSPDQFAGSERVVNYLDWRRNSGTGCEGTIKAIKCRHFVSPIEILREMLSSRQETEVKHVRLSCKATENYDTVMSIAVKVRMRGGLYYRVGLQKYKQYSGKNVPGIAVAEKTIYVVATLDNIQPALQEGGGFRAVVSRHISTTHLFMKSYLRFFWCLLLVGATEMLAKRHEPIIMIVVFVLLTMISRLRPSGLALLACLVVVVITYHGDWIGNPPNLFKDPFKERSARIDAANCSLIPTPVASGIHADEIALVWRIICPGDQEECYKIPGLEFARRVGVPVGRVYISRTEWGGDMLIANYSVLQ